MPSNYSYTPEFNKWTKDGNGFLRVKVRFLAVGVMQYAAHEIGEAADPEFPDKVYKIMVPPETLGDPKAIRSLEGMPVLAYDHQWLGPGEEYRQVGQVAGTPTVVGDYLEGYIVITDADAIAATMARELSDISAAYSGAYDMTAAPDGFYDGLQRDLSYNHVALLRPGEGRAGLDVRVLNRRRAETMANEFTNVRLGGKSFNVATEHVQIFNAAVDEVEAKATENEAATAKNVEELLAQLEEANAKVKEVTGELTSVKERMDKALAPENLEAEAEAMLNERNEAADALVQNGIEEDKEKAFNSLKGLRGHDLRAKVVSVVRTANKRPDLTDEEAKDEPYIRGVYRGYVENAAPASGSVVGADIVRGRIANAGKAPSEYSPSERLFGRAKKEA